MSPLKPIGKVTLKKDICFTVNLFDDASAIAGKTLLLMEQNPVGDCFCLNQEGQYLVDVDHRDVEKVVKTASPFDRVFA